MSNNDLPCEKCGGQHHPACCPLDLPKDPVMSWEKEFDKKFRELTQIHDNGAEEIRTCEVKTFIRKLLEKQNKDDGCISMCPEVALLQNNNKLLFDEIMDIKKDLMSKLEKFIKEREHMYDSKLEIIITKWREHTSSCRTKIH